jgi:hypothetical protein
MVRPLGRPYYAPSIKRVKTREERVLVSFINSHALPSTVPQAALDIGIEPMRF